MARSVKFTKVEGLDDLAKAVEKLKGRVSGKEVQNVLLSGAFVIRDEAKARVPVDTGRLRDNIIATKGKPKGEGLDVLVGVRYGKGGGNQAHIIEHGSSKIAPRPFFRPAVSAKKTEAGEKIAEGLKKLIEDKK